MTTTRKKEGFWYSKSQENLLYPKPEVRISAMIDKREFLTRLLKKQSRTPVIAYKGWSTCRVCGQHNGSTTYTSKTWEWPEGYAHYVEAHNVRPSAEFKTYIMGDEHA